MKPEKESDETPQRPVNKATMDQPQEEFVADQSMPSHSDPANDRDHGDEVAAATTGEAERQQS